MPLNSSSLVDLVGNTWTLNGDTSLSYIDNSVSKFGGGSLHVEGNGCLLSTYNSLFDFGTGDFTIDFWWKCLDTQSDMFPISANIFGQNATGNMVIHGFGGYIALGLGNQGYYNYWYFDTTSICDGNWHHFAFIRKDNKPMFFIDGSTSRITSENLTDPDNVDYSNDATMPISIFAQSDPNTNPTYGYINYYRISNVALWAGDFTPPEI